MKLLKTDGPIGFGLHNVQLSTQELLLLEVALNEAQVHFDSDAAQNPPERSTANLWMENRQMCMGIHQSGFGRAQGALKDILQEIGLK